MQNLAKCNTNAVDDAVPCQKRNTNAVDDAEPGQMEQYCR